MKRLFQFILILLLFLNPLTSDDQIEKLLSDFPCLNARYAESFGIKETSNLKCLRTAPLKNISLLQMTCNSNELLINEKPVVFLSEDLSKVYLGSNENNWVIYKWEFKTETSGNYILTNNSPAGSMGFLNNEQITIINNGVVSKLNSGRQWNQLQAGTNILYIATRKEISKELGIASEKSIEKIKTEIQNRLNPSDLLKNEWAINNFFPYLSTLQNGIFQHINALLAQQNIKSPFAKSKEMANFFLIKILNNLNYNESYRVESYIYQNFPDIYFLLFKTIPVNTYNGEQWNCFLLTNNNPRLIYLEQLIYDGKKDLADQYFEKCLEIIKNNFEKEGKGRMIGAFYAQRFICYFRIGRIKEMFNLLPATEEKSTIETEQSKTFKTLVSYFKADGKPETEDKIVLTQSYDDTFAFQLKEQIENYDGAEEQLSKLFNIFVGLQHRLIRTTDLSYSFNSYFQFCSNKNIKFKNDFTNYCKNKIENVRQSPKSISLAEELLEKYEAIIDLPEQRIFLMEEYFKRGDFLKSLSNAYRISEKYPQLLSQIINQVLILEDFSHLTKIKRIKIPDKFFNQEIKIKGESATIGKMINHKEEINIASKKIGRLMKIISLEPVHIQYWHHPWLPYYQPIEPVFTDKNIYFNGGSYLYQYSIEQNESINKYYSGQEYLNANENGPHQKRFITTHSANQLFMFTNKINSSQKTVKCFDLNLNLQWDLCDQKIAAADEPFCTPIESQGKLFCFSYDKKETIKVINFSVYDAQNGERITRTPISYMPAPSYDEVGSRRMSNWNTYTHDEHFIQDQGFVYGFTGTGILLKADANSGHISWVKGFAKTSINNREVIYDAISFAASGFIKIYSDLIITFMPDIQTLSAVHKTTGDLVWQTVLYKPQFFHDRGKTDFLYFSDTSRNAGNSIFKINPIDGQIIWQTSTQGLAIYGEGDILENKLYIPTEKSIVIIDQSNGYLIETIPLNIQPLKIRCSEKNSIIFTAASAFIFQNQGILETNQILEQDKSTKIGNFIKPTTAPESSVSFENINLELTLKIPETKYNSISNTNRTKFEKTSLPFHFIMKNGAHITLFREGNALKDGTYLPPEIIWYSQHPYHFILNDIIYIAESGKIKAKNLFTLENLWEIKFENINSINKNKKRKSPLVITANHQYIAFQTEHQSICLVSQETKAIIKEISSPEIAYLYLKDNFIITMNSTDLITCYDISQDYKEIWTKRTSLYPHEIYPENNILVLIEYRSRSIQYFDLKTGEQIKKLENPSLQPIRLVFNLLYDASTGTTLPKYGEGLRVIGGGYLGFFSLYGALGNYIEDGKEYSFQLRSGRDQNYANIAAIKKGNKIAIINRSFIETFEIQNDKLVAIDETRFNAGSGYTSSMELQPLDNSILEIRNDEMYFFRNFDQTLAYEKIQSFRVENKKSLNWPHGELYPEIKTSEKNWVSFYGKKPNRDLAYQAFGDDKFVYLKFKLNANPNNESKSTLYVSTNDNRNTGESIALNWEVDDWKKCQYTQNIRENIDSWKEIDIKGDINLYIKLRLGNPFANTFKNTLPDFNIELRQYTNNKCDGMYRLGGAYHQTKKLFTWLVYTNDEAQSLKNYTLRSALYEKTINFYPQGEDIILWIKDRRRFKSVSDNILFLNKMLEANAKSYCSVNILSALFLEEIQLIKENNPAIDELSDSFSIKAKETNARLYTSALAKGISKEWAEFALSYYTIEVYPFKTFLTDSNGRILTKKAVTGIQIQSGNVLIYKSDFSEDNNILTPNVNQPYLEWILPGLAPSYPKGLEINNIVLLGAGTSKTGLGKMSVHTPTTSFEFVNRMGVFQDKKNKIIEPSRKGELKIALRNYISKKQQFECFSVSNPEYLNNILINVPPIKQPLVINDKSQMTNSILTAIENLPSDSNMGQMMVADYLNINGNVDDKSLKLIYNKWLFSMRDNANSCYRAIRNIHTSNINRKDVYDFILAIIKETKLSTIAPRIFFIDTQNKFSDTRARSVLGPIFSELDIKPEVNFELAKEYKSKEVSYKFTESLLPQKGGTIYIASKIIVSDKEKVFLFARASGPYFSGSLFSIWLNGKPIVENEIFQKYDYDTLVQKINLNAGENVILLKINGNNNYHWSNDYAFCIGDVYGSPIKGIELKPVH
jgi:hypothetical protein